MLNTTPYILIGAAALLFAWVLYIRVKKHSPGNERMIEIGGYIREGAMAFLMREYKILFFYAIGIFIVLTLVQASENFHRLHEALHRIPQPYGSFFVLRATGRSG